MDIWTLLFINKSMIWWQANIIYTVYVYIHLYGCCPSLYIHTYTHIYTYIALLLLWLQNEVVDDEIQSSLWWWDIVYIYFTYMYMDIVHRYACEQTLHFIMELICIWGDSTTAFLISSYGAPLAQRASYLSPLWARWHC